MKYMIKAIATVAVLSFPFVAKAAIPDNFPKELMYEGKPINALCLTSFPKATLPECEDKGIKITGENKQLTDKGYVGFDYTQPPTDKVSIETQGYAYYKPLTSINGSHAISIINNTGGNGEFTEIVLVKREGNVLQFKSLTAQGDRCNGGLSDVQAKNNKITYNQNLTASNYLELAKQNPHKLKPYDDLADCAACCVGKAKFEIDPTKSAKHPTLLSVDLGSEQITPSKESQGKYQFCFETLVASYQKEGKQILTPQQLKEFVTKFNKTCVKNPA